MSEKETIQVAEDQYYLNTEEYEPQFAKKYPTAVTVLAFDGP